MAQRYAGRTDRDSANDAATDGVEDDFRGAMYVKFLEDARAMCFHRTRADEEERSDVLVRLPFRNQLKHLTLAIR